MVHVAIMKKSWKLTGKILSGEKTVETRWYKNRVAPWGKIHEGETVYFKDSGEPVTVAAEVAKVEQFEDIDETKSRKLISVYGVSDTGTEKIDPAIDAYTKGKRYCIFVHLKNPQRVKPFEIDKSGYGAMAAWLCVDDIGELRGASS